MNAVTTVRNIKVFRSEDRHTQKAKLSILLLIVFSIATTGHFVLCRLKPVFIQEAASLDNSVEMRMVKVKKTIKAWKSCHVMCLGQILKYFSYLRTFALIVCAQPFCAGNATVICHASRRLTGLEDKHGVENAWLKNFRPILLLWIIGDPYFFNHESRTLLTIYKI